MKQIILGASPGQGYVYTSPYYCTIRATKWLEHDNPGLPLATASHPWSVPGTFSKLWCHVNADVGHAQTWPDLIFTLMINGVASALTATIPANTVTSSAQNTADMVTVAAGDVLTMRREGNSTPPLNGQNTPFSWSMTFTSTNARESGYGLGSATALNTTDQYVCAPWNGDYNPWQGGNWNTGGGSYGEVYRWSLVPCAGNVFRHDIQLTTAPGGGGTRTFLILVNGVAQNGSGGTPDSRVTFSGSTTTGHATYTVPLVVGDRLTLEQTITGTPASTYVMCSTGFRATTDGQSALCFDTANAHPNNAGVTDYTGSELGGWAQTTAVAQPTPPGPPATEAILALPGGIDPFTLSGLFVSLTNAGPGLGNTYTFTTRKNLATPVGGPTSAVTGTSPQNIGTGTVTFSAPTDLMTMSAVASGTTPLTAAQVGWTWAQIAASSPAPPGPGTARVLRRVRRFPFPYHQNKQMQLRYVQFIVQSGMGLTPGPASDPPVLGSDPVIMFRVSYDGGETWGHERQLSIGRQGAYTYRAFGYNFGQGRNLVGEVSCTDPIPLAFLDCVAEILEGTS